VLRAAGEHFSSGTARSAVFLEVSPEHVSQPAWNIAAPARCTKPVIAAARSYWFRVGFELSLACDLRLVSETCLHVLPDLRLARPRSRPTAPTLRCAFSCAMVPRERVSSD
jgi:2-oxoglutaroyl-CoA hydrolase